MDNTIADLSIKLTAQAHKVAAMLLPAGKMEGGREWVCGDVTGKPGDSLKVTLVGTYAGQWKDWSTDSDKGDLIDLWRLAKNITAAEAINQVKAFLGIVDKVKPSIAKTYRKPPTVSTVVPNPIGQVMLYLKNERKLTDEVIAAYGVQGCPEKRAIVFPGLSPSGELLNRSYRTLGAEKKVWQDSECAPCMFGWCAVPESSYRERKILISEGQIDAMTWAQWGIPAISLPNGTGTTWVEFEWDNLAPFDTIYLAFDQDLAGKKLTDTIVGRLGKHRCLIVAMPKKDANDCLKEGYKASDAAEWIANAKTPTIKKLMLAKDMAGRLDSALVPQDEPFTLPFLKYSGWRDDQAGFWYRPAEVTLTAGYSFAGKTTFLNFLQSNLVADQQRTFVASLEMKVEKLLMNLISNFYGKDVTTPIITSFLKHAGEHIVYVDHVGTLAQDELMEMMWFAFRRYGCTHFVIDSLMRIEGLEEKYPEQGAFISNLQNFAKETGAHVHLVAHLTKPQKQTSGEHVPSMYDVKGSSLLINNPDNVIILRRNPKKEELRKKVGGRLTLEQERSMHDLEVIVEKQRESGWTGMFKLNYDKVRKAYSKFNG